MSSLFYSLEIAKTGLYVSQKAMSVTSNNVANASTAGYTRQRVVIDSITSSADNRFKCGIASTGGGATVKQVDQVRSEYIDKQLRDGYSTQGNWGTRSQEMEFIESILNELSDSSSISSSLSDFYDSLQSLSTNPDSLEIRTNVQQNGIKLCETLGYYYNALVEQQNSYNTSMLATVNSVNDLLSGIAEYNHQIYAYELSGQPANELRDRRNTMLDELSGLIDIDYSQDADGKLTVSCNGSVLVNHTTATLLEARPELTGVVSGEPGYYEIYLEGGTTPITYTSGQLQAYKDLRDGDSVDSIGIPYMLSSLNTLAQSLASEFNSVHETGYTLPYGTNLSRNGVDFFEVPAGGYSDITAGNLSLSSDILNDVHNIATSDSIVIAGDANSQQGNNVIALELYRLSTKTDITGIGNFEDFIKSFIVQVGISSSSAQDKSASQDAIVDNLETRKESISGVSIDEEMVNMLSFQYAYAAAARVLTAIDEAMNTLINGTGKVGL